MPTDFDAALARNLAFLRWLTARLAEASTVSRRDQFLKEYARALERRFVAVEEFIVPALTAHGVNAELFAALVAHEPLRPRLADVLAHGLERPALEPTVLAFVRHASEHLQREAVVLGTLVRQHLRADEIAALAAELQTQLGSGGTAPAEEPPAPLRRRLRTG